MDICSVLYQYCLVGNQILLCKFQRVYQEIKYLHKFFVTFAQAFTRKVNFNNVDAYAVYSPIMNKCYYVHKQEILNSNNTTTFNLRITEPVVKGNNVFRMVSEYEDVNIIFGNVAESGLL